MEKQKEYKVNRNLDGAFFRIERDGIWQNICFSDLTEEERTFVLKNMTDESLKILCCHLADSIKEIGEQLDIVDASSYLMNNPYPTEDNPSDK